MKFALPIALIVGVISITLLVTEFINTSGISALFNRADNVAAAAEGTLETTVESDEDLRERIRRAKELRHSESLAIENTTSNEERTSVSSKTTLQQTTQEQPEPAVEAPVEETTPQIGKEEPTKPTPSKPAVVVEPFTADPIFYDYFLASWSIGEVMLGASIQMSTSNALHGTKALNVELPGNWFEMYLHNSTGVATKNKEGLKLNIKGAAGGENVHLAFFDRNHERIGAVRIQDYTRERKITTAYQSVFIPLSALGAKNVVVGDIILSSPDYAHVYIDDIQFGNPEDGVQVVGAHAVTHPDVFIDDFVNAWTKTTWGTYFQLDTEQVLSGNAIRIVFEETNSNLYLENTIGFDTEVTHHLEFFVRGNVAAADLVIAMYDENLQKLGSTALKDYLDGDYYGSYTKVRIPLKDMGAERTIVKAILFESQSGSGDMVFFENIRFTF